MKTFVMWESFHFVRLGPVDKLFFLRKKKDKYLFMDFVILLDEVCLFIYQRQLIKAVEVMKGE